MVITDCVKNSTNPLLPEASQFLKKGDIFTIDYKYKQIGICSKSEGLSLYTPGKELLWEINKPIVGVLLAIEHQQIWLAQRHDAEHITIWAYNLQGKALTSMPMDNEIYDVSIELKALPNNKAVITFYGGQNGCTSYLLSFENEKLKVAKQLPNDVGFCCMLNEKEATFTNFYEAEPYVTNYSSLKTLKRHHFSEDWGAVARPFKGDKILITDMYCSRYYIFDISTFIMEDEIIFKSFKPYKDGVEEFLVSDIDELHYHNDQLIASYMGVDSERNAIYHWLTSKLKY